MELRRMKLDDLLPWVATFALPTGAGLIGAGLADVASSSHVVGALVGGLFGLLSIIARGVFDLARLKEIHRNQQHELRANRYRKKLTKAGIDPDTED